MSRRIIVHADVAQVGAECSLDLASNVRGQRGTGGLPLHGFGCHSAVVLCDRLRRSNRQIHRQRALADRPGARDRHAHHLPDPRLLGPAWLDPSSRGDYTAWPGMYRATGRLLSEPAAARQSRERCCRLSPVYRSRSSAGRDPWSKIRRSAHLLAHRCLHARSRGPVNAGRCGPCRRPRRAPRIERSTCGTVSAVFHGNPASSLWESAAWNSVG